MKKIFCYLLCSLLFWGCSKKGTNEIADFVGSNFVTQLSDAKGLSFIGKMRVGHNGAGCNGCVTIGGVREHVDCKGYGDYCEVGISIGLTGGNGGYYSGIVLSPDELTYDESFLMPDRSLYIIGSNGEFLNIPEQMLYRDEETGTFIFYDIFFSDVQMFENK